MEDTEDSPPISAREVRSLNYSSPHKVVSYGVSVREQLNNMSPTPLSRSKDPLSSVNTSIMHSEEDMSHGHNGSSPGNEAASSNAHAESSNGMVAATDQTTPTPRRASRLVADLKRAGELKRMREGDDEVSGTETDGYNSPADSDVSRYTDI